MEWEKVFKNLGIFLVRTAAVLALFSVALVTGIIIGYSILGKGSPNPLDVFDLQMWKDLFGFVFSMN